LTPGLARCVGDVGRFVDEHWAAAPLHREASDAAGFADLLSLDDVDHLVSSTFARLPSFRLVRDGKPLDPATYTKSARLGGRPISDVGDPGRVYEEFRNGATIVLQGLHRSWLPLSRFCRQLELELTHPVQTNAYVTPPGSQGLAVHHDTHDVFVLQVAGAKEWSVYPPVVENPLPSQRWSADLGSPGDPVLCVELRPGDTLYIPRGFPHSARSREGVSAHLTIGVLAYTWHDVLHSVVGDILDGDDFRPSLPPGFADDDAQLAAGLSTQVARLRDRLQEVDTAAAAATFARRFWSTRPPVLSGQLRQLMVLPHVGDASSVRRREGSICRLAPAEEGLEVLLADRRLDVPASLEAVLRRLVDGGPFRVGDLADQLDEPSRLVLVRRLVREGLLEVVSTA
jgi:hypothetical protein